MISIYISVSAATGSGSGMDFRSYSSINDVNAITRIHDSLTFLGTT